MKKFINYSSPWASLLSFTLMSAMMSLVMSLKQFESTGKMFLWGVNISIIMVFILMYMWVRDSSRESLMGFNNNDISSNIKLAVVLFLISEAFFFISFFWMFFYSAMAPEMGYWPPVSLWSPSFIGAPSLNTILLVSSSATVTMCHYDCHSKTSYSLAWLKLTLILSFMFITVQWLEYESLPFSFTSSVGGAVFFISTGFHGMHVIIGTLALGVSLLLMMKNYFTVSSMLGFELAVWYWHFVDAIWLMLYIVFYCWGH
uniref:Cytochrome c oxidase subunit 3 n=1 Tax=Capillaria sp. cat-2018 TaxID=2488633 RepID=A0A6M2UJF8_9BILA|nr:cytochrome c oxidase subunit III [Capillaria sp. cat-2018]